MSSMPYVADISDIRVTLDNPRLQFTWVCETGQKKSHWIIAAWKAQKVRLDLAVMELAGPQAVEAYCVGFIRALPSDQIA